VEFRVVHTKSKVDISLFDIIYADNIVISMRIWEDAREARYQAATLKACHLIGITFEWVQNQGGFFWPLQA
jgi:hypothetical protein